MQVQKIDVQSPNAPEKFVQSLRDTGFAVLENHQVNDDLLDEVYEEWARFFARSEEDKRRYLYDPNFAEVQDGFFPMEVAETAKGRDVKDLKEFYHAYPNRPLPEGVSDKTMEMRRQLMTIGHWLLEWIENSLPEEVDKRLSMPLTEMVDDQYQTLLRVLHYPPVPDDVESGAERAAAHEDINLITLLVAATAPGLQVKDVQGNWLEVPCSRNAIIVNTGDMLQECTEGFFPATTHRVVNPEGEAAKQSRYSMPLFIHPRNEVRLSSRYTAKEYLTERLSELGLLND